MTKEELEKEAEEYTLKKLVGLEDFDSYQSAYDRYENGVQDAFQDGAEFGYNKAKAETALLSQHILDLQKDKGNLTDRVRELEQQIEKMKSDVISERDEAKRLEDVITYTVLNNILAKWGIKEND